MKITSITIQARDNNRANVSVDGKYKFSLEISQVVDLGLKPGQDYNKEEIISFEEASSFGKLYSRALEYTLSRPRSMSEIRRYLHLKTVPRLQKDGKRQAIYSVDQAVRVFDRLKDRGYIDDAKFAKFWIENRFQKKGISQKRLSYELMQKGVDKSIIEEVFSITERGDEGEIEKIIAKKRLKYDDDKKLMAYLARQGFSYDDISRALSKNCED